MTASTPRPSKRASRAWELVRLVLDAHGWTFEGEEELVEPAVETEPESSEVDVAAERRRAAEAALASIPAELEFLRKGIESFELLAVHLRLLVSCEKPGTAGEAADETPPNVFALPRCTAADGRHALVKVAGGAGGVGLLRCTRCDRRARLGGSAEEAGTIN